MISYIIFIASYFYKGRRRNIIISIFFYIIFIIILFLSFILFFGYQPLVVGDREQAGGQRQWRAGNERHLPAWERWVSPLHQLYFIYLLYYILLYIMFWIPIEALGSLDDEVMHVLDGGGSITVPVDGGLEGQADLAADRLLLQVRRLPPHERPEDRVRHSYLIGGGRKIDIISE